MKNFFGIIGGMGTLASTQFINDMNRYYAPDKDQSYLNYVLWNHAEVPDRTAFILGHSDESPYPPILNAAQSLESLGADFIVMPCNTAHYFINELQKEIKIPIINLLDTVTSKLDDPKVLRVGIMATEGTIRSRLFHGVIEDAGKEVVEPSEDIQRTVMSIIYDDVKKRNHIDEEKFNRVVKEYFELGVDKIIIGCTELSYVASKTSHKIDNMIDSQQLAVLETIEAARKSQHK